MALTSGSNTLIGKHMPTTRRRILILLKEKGGLTADELAALLGISAVAVRRHLTKLERDQLVVYEEVQRGMGRPSFVYRLGEAAANFFPRSYEELATVVLETIREMYGAEAIDAIFGVRTEHIIENYRRKIDGKTLDARLEQLTKLRQADGYMSTWEPGAGGVFVLRETNCPIVNVAESCGSACNHDVTILEDLLDAKVIRTSNLAQGDGACCYEIRAKTDSEQS